MTLKNIFGFGKKNTNNVTALREFTSVADNAQVNAQRRDRLSARLTRIGERQACLENSIREHYNGTEGYEGIDPVECTNLLEICRQEYSRLSLELAVV